MIPRVLGLSSDMPFDRLYVVEPSNMLEKDFTFYGHQNSKIFHDMDSKRWKIEMLNDRNIYATTEGSEPPLGTRKYQLSESLGEGTILLNLNSCDNSEEYNCNDGACIHMERKTDLIYDCKEGDDEIQSPIIRIPKAYHNTHPYSSGM